MLNHLDSLKSTLLQKLREQQLTVNSLKEKNQRLDSRVAILEHAIQAHERRGDDNEQNNRRVCLRVEGMPLEGRETEEDLPASLKKISKILGLTLLGTRLKEQIESSQLSHMWTTLVKKPQGSRLLSSLKAGVIAQRFTELVKNPEVTDTGLTLPGDA